MHSNIVFQPPFSLNFGFPSKKPTFRTLIQMPVSGRGEIRASLQPYPLWEITYDMDHARGGEQDQNSVYQYMLGFFLAMGGSFSDFLYLDPYDNRVENVYLATGDGSTTQFQLTRPIGIGTDIVQNPIGQPVLFTPGYGGAPGTQNLLIWSQDQTRSAWGKNEVTVSGPVASPDGGPSAYTVTPDSGATDCYIDQSTSPPTIGQGGEFTLSFWLQASSGTPTINIFLLNQSSTVRGQKPVTLSTAWQKFTLTANFEPGDTLASVQIGGANTWNSSVGAINVAWFQLEPGNSPSAYIGTANLSYYYTLQANGFVLFSYAPPNGAVLTWTGGYYYRVRFEDDDIQFDQFMEKLWSSQSIKLKSVIL